MNFFRFFPRVDYPLGDNASLFLTDISRHVNVRELFRDDLMPYLYADVGDGRRPDVLSHELYETPAYWWTFFLVNDHLADGLDAWPRTRSAHDIYMTRRYPFYVIQPHQTNENVDNDHIVLYYFKVGETLTQGTKTGTILDIRPEMNQIITDIKFDEGTPIIGEENTINSDTSFGFEVLPERYAYREYRNDEGQVVTPFTFSLPERSGLKLVTNEMYEDELRDSRSYIRYIRPDYINEFRNAFRLEIGQ